MKVVGVEGRGEKSVDMERWNGKEGGRLEEVVEFLRGRWKGRRERERK